MMIDGFDNMLPQRQARFELTQGQTTQLRIALETLLGNSWEFTSGRAKSRVEFGVNLEKDMPVYFIRDNGASFNMTYATKLFSPFQQLHAAEEFPGIGTVHRIVDKHGGKR